MEQNAALFAEADALAEVQSSCAPFCSRSWASGDKLLEKCGINIGKHVALQKRGQLPLYFLAFFLAPFAFSASALFLARRARCSSLVRAFCSSVRGFMELYVAW